VNLQLSAGESGVLIFNKSNLEVCNFIVQLSIFLIDLFAGTYRLSSHARLEAFVIQTKLSVGDFPFCLYN